MIALLQRVAEARVDIAGQTVGRIDHGLLVLVCAEPDDTEAVGQKLLAKILKLRIFSDEQGKMNRSVQDVAGGLLIVSQFTLAADTKSGNRPGFTGAAAPDEGRRLYGAIYPRVAAINRELASGLTAAQRQQLDAMVDSLQARLGSTPDHWVPGAPLWVVSVDYDTGRRVVFGRAGGPPSWR